VADPGFRHLLTAGPTRRVWVKLSGAYRNGPNGGTIARAAVPLLCQAFGLDRLVWGSDWPHTQFETAASYATARDALDTWLPEATERQVVLAETPAALFRLTF
jgi:predicted TIM-barrel fold metal-dependent hydrolase